MFHFNYWYPTPSTLLLVGNYTHRERKRGSQEFDKLNEETIKEILIPTLLVEVNPQTGRQRDVKNRRIILDAVKDHVIPHLFEKNTTREMWEALMKLY